MTEQDMRQLLFLDTYGLSVPFSIKRSEIERSFAEKKVVVESLSETQVTIRSELFSLNLMFCVSFFFCREKMIQIMISPCEILNGRELQKRYALIQKELGRIYGRPINLAQKIVNLVAPAEQFLSRKSGGVTVKHYLLNRLGSEEIIEIGLRR